MTPEVLPDELLAVMRPEELRAYRDHLQKAAALDGLYAYMAFCTPSLKDYPHLILLCDWIDALLEGRLYADGPGPEPVDGKHPLRGDPVLYNLAIYEPPRHGKSFTVSDHLPSYAQIKYPGIKEAFSTYEAEFAKKWSAKVRDRLHEHVEFFGVGVKGGMNAARESWESTASGEYKCAGVGGPITGHGWQLGIADDLIKNAEEALSETDRQKKHEWWVTTWWTRRERWFDGTPARAILMNTRWHADDISSRVVDAKWAVLRIPAIAEDNPDEPDLLGRFPGEALCEEIMPLAELEELREREPQWFAAMYQGKPYIEGGNLIHGPFNYVKLEEGRYAFTDESGATSYVPEAECFRFGVIDLAASLKTRADWTVLGVFDVTPQVPRRLVLRHLLRERLTSENHEEWAVEAYRRWHLKFLVVEDKTFGTNLIGQLRKRGGVTLRPVKPDTDKVIRALPLDSRIRNGELWWSAEAAWRQTLEEEILTFPNAAHDDQVDVLAYADLIFGKLPRPRKPREERGMTPDERAAAHIAALKGNRKGRPLHPLLGRL